MRGRLIRSNFQMNFSTLINALIRCGSPRVNTRLIARQEQRSFGRSSQTIRVARGNRISNVAAAKLPSLIQLSPACASISRVLKPGTSASVHWGCQTASKVMTGAPVISPSRRAKVVLPAPARPSMTIRLLATPGPEMRDCNAVLDADTAPFVASSESADASRRLQAPSGRRTH